MSGVQAFIGSWREEEKTGYDEMANAISKSRDLKHNYTYSHFFHFANTPRLIETYIIS